MSLSPTMYLHCPSLIEVRARPPWNGLVRLSHCHLQVFRLISEVFSTSVYTVAAKLFWSHLGKISASRLPGPGRSSWLHQPRKFPFGGRLLSKNNVAGPSTASLLKRQHLVRGSFRLFAASGAMALWWQGFVWTARLKLRVSRLASWGRSRKSTKKSNGLYLLV